MKKQNTKSTKKQSRLFLFAYKPVNKPAARRPTFQTLLGTCAGLATALADLTTVADAVRAKRAQ